MNVNFEIISNVGIVIMASSLDAIYQHMGYTIYYQDMGFMGFALYSINVYIKIFPQNPT
jgi:hypothetical protein